MKISRLLLAGSMSCLAINMSAHAYAQDAGAEPADTVAEDSASDAGDAPILVTGSRIFRAETDSIVPVAIVGIDNIQQDASLNVQDLLQELPQFGIGTSRTNSNFSTSGNGTATLNLRSLGSNRTLVLVNGRRHIAGFAGSSSVDVNNIPTEFLDRVEIVTGGASSVYGSEAISGVVNFIMKEEFDGLEFRAQSNITGRGDNPRYLASLTAGGKLFDDRLSVIANMSYDRDDGLRSNKRKRSQQDCSAPVGAPGNGIICGPQSYSVFSAQGQFYYNLRGTGATPVVANGGNTASFSFNLDNSVLFGQGPGFNRNNERYISVPVERYLGSFISTFDVTDNLQFFLEGTYSKVKSRSRLEPSAIGIGLIAAADVTSSIQLDNPFIPAAVRAQINALNSDANPANDVVSISTRRRFNEVFDRSNKNDRDTSRLTFGVKGDIGKWRYDASYVYGRFEDYTESETADKSRIANALDAVVIGGQTVCRSAAARAQGCAPLNLFGYGTASAAASAYVQATIPRSLQIVNEHHIASANISGSPFSLWAGEVGFAAGVEYREEKALSDNDPLTNAGLNIGNQTQDLKGKFNVKDVYGELNVPLLDDMGVSYLGVNGAVRYSDYSTVGGVVSWNVGAEFEPVKGIRLRGVFARANRAPNINELFQAANETFATITDPCNGVNATNNPGVSTTFPSGFGAACRAIPAIQAVVNAGGTFSYTLAQQQQINGFIGGNQNLNEETADTITIGAVFTPSFLPGLSLTADYYDIRLAEAISTLGRPFSVQQCLLTGDPVFCSNVFRGTDGRITRVDGQFINVAKVETRGVDIGLRYRGELGLRPDDMFSWTVNYTRLIDYKSQGNPAAPVVELVPTAGLSKHRGNARAAYSADGFTLSWGMTYASKAVSSVTFANANKAIERLNNIRAYIYHDVQLRFDLGEEDRFALYMGVDNLFDEQPPYLPSPPFASITGTETLADTYDPYGRRFYAGLRVKF